MAEIRLEQDEITRLIEYVEQGQKRINSAKELIARNTTDFEIWYKYCENKYHYESLLGVNTKIRQLINNHMSWLISEEYYGFILDTEYLIAALETLSQEKKIDKEYIQDVKAELVNYNFGSMKINW